MTVLPGPYRLARAGNVRELQMPRIRILTSLAGASFAYRRGEEVDVPAPLASQWCMAGWAELVRGEQVEAPERAHPASETAARRRGRR